MGIERFKHGEEQEIGECVLLAEGLTKMKVHEKKLYEASNLTMEGKIQLEETVEYRWG